MHGHEVVSRVDKPERARSVKHDRKPLPQWILDLQAAHKGASRRELSKIMNDMRQRAQRRMEMLNK